MNNLKRFSREIKLGLTGIVALAVLYYGISFLKGMNLFKSSNVYYVTFQDAKGLTKSSPVYADGFGIGIVSDISYDYSNPKNVTVEIAVDDELRIPAGSTASLETELLGTIKLHILLANNPRQRLEAGDTIPGTIQGGLMDAASGLLPQVEQLLPKMDSILASVNALLADPALANILHNTDHMTANLDKATAKLDRLLTSEFPEMVKNLNQASQNSVRLTADLDEKLNQLDIDGLMTKVNGTLNNVETLTTKLNSKDNTVGLLLNDPTLYNNLAETSANAASLLGDLQSHPKRYVHFSLFGKKDK